MKRSALILAAGLALLVGSPASSVGKTPPPPTTLLAFERGGDGLMQVDPLTLRRKGAPLITADPLLHAFSPDGDRVVLAGLFTQLELVDVRAMRKLGRFPSLGRSSWVDGLFWADPGRIVVFVRAASSRVVTLDPDTRRVVSDVPLAGEVTATGRGRNSLGVLVGPQEGIGPSRLHVVDALGRVRTVSLQRVRSGWEVTRDGKGRRVSPGVALDPTGRRAVLIQPAGPAAEVDLATLDVAYHDLQRARSLAARLHDWLEPQAQAKQVFGPEVWAHWVGGDAVVFASWEHAGIGTRGNENRALVRAHGVFLVDTRKWTRRTLSETASGIEAVGDTALVFAGPFAPGRPFGADRGRPPRGLDAYATDGKRRFRLFGSRAVGGAQGAGAYAYVRVSERAWDVVDVRSGRVLGRARTANSLSLLPRD